MFSVLVDGSSSLPVPGMVTELTNQAVLNILKLLVFQRLRRKFTRHDFLILCVDYVLKHVSVSRGFTPSSLLNNVRSSVFSLVLSPKESSVRLEEYQDKKWEDILRYDEMFFPSRMIMLWIWKMTFPAQRIEANSRVCKAMQTACEGESVQCWRRRLQHSD